MQQVAELLETGIYETFSPKNTTTIKQILEELKLTDLYFGLLVNGKKAIEDQIVGPEDKIVIIPHIKGGSDEEYPTETPNLNEIIDKIIDTLKINELSSLNTYKTYTYRNYEISIDIRINKPYKNPVLDGMKIPLKDDLNIIK